MIAQVHPRRPDGAVVRRLGDRSPSEFIKKHPDEAKKFIAAYAKGVELRAHQAREARQYLKGYTAIEGPLTSEVPLAAYTLYNEFTPADIAYFQKFFDLFTEKGIFSTKRLMVDDHALQGLSRWPPIAHRPQALGAARRDARAAPRASRRGAPAAVLGPLVLFIVWDLVVRTGFIKADPAAAARWTRWARWSPACAGGPLLTDFAVTVWRTLQAFLIAAVVGVPLGVLLGSNETRLPQRRVPDRLLPLHAVVGADPAVPADLRRVGHQQGGDRRVRRVPDRACSTAPTA